MLGNVYSVFPHNVDGGCTAWMLQLLRFVFLQVRNNREICFIT